MTLKFVDRVLETTTTSGTGTINLAGPVANFRSFSVAGNGSKVGYLIDDSSSWEIGTGTVTTGSPNTLSRTNVIASSNSNALVNFGSNAKNVRLVPIASLVMNRDESLNFTDLLGTAGGTANAHTVAMPVAPLAYTDGAVYMWKAPATNTSTTVTVNVDGRGAKNIKINGSDPVVGQIVNGALLVGVYNNATGFVDIINSLGSAFLPLAGGNMTGAVNEKLTTLASATTPDIWTGTGNVIDYTGTATATGFAPAPQAGARRTLVCAGACSFTAGANVLINGVASGNTYTAAAGDQIIVTAITTSQVRLAIIKADGKAVVASTSVFQNSFESSEIAITAGADHSAAHGLGQVPKFWYAVVRCKTAELGYSVGDEVHIYGGDAGATNSYSVRANATTVGVRPASGYTFAVVNLSTGGNATVTAANWRVVLRAYV